MATGVGVESVVSGDSGGCLLWAYCDWLGGLRAKLRYSSSDCKRNQIKSSVGVEPIGAVAGCNYDP